MGRAKEARKHMTQANTTYGDQIKWASGLNALAGLWLIVSPFVLSYSNLQGAMWDDMILGVVIGAIALARFSGAYMQAWLSWVNLVLSAWIFVSPFVLGFTSNQVALWDNLIFGAVVFLLAGRSALASPRTAATR
jgi:SPW repeat